MSAWAQDVIEFKGEFNEELRDDSNISGSLLVGVVASGPVEAMSSMLSARLPTDWPGGSICVTVVSGNGLYDSRNEYITDAEFAGDNPSIEYPSNFRDQLKSFNREDVAVRVKAGGCDSEDGAYAPAHWRTTPNELSRLDILINSFRAEEVLLYPSPTASTHIACSQIEVGGQTAFDSRCTVEGEDLADLVAQGGEVEMEVINIRDGNVGDSVLFSVMIGSAR